MMGEKTKYLIMVLITILVSSATSYITTTLTMQNIQNDSQNKTKTKVNFDVKGVNFDIDMVFNTVHTNPNVNVDNLTIVYQYTCPNGTKFTESIDYGSYTPTWGSGAVIDPGGAPDVYFRIPEYIIRASSSTMTNEYGTKWDVYPQVEVLEIYGYS